ncbi:BA14K family protein [Polycladidibacter hongkongensis]|uniref:BA14K family protein n=1 Tax=Polycladidibacter hongkongensis TaxID=1647556 RepID=UPI000833F770|nr:BA14K family protein [Pseudovibrio hongkongensis]
MSVRKNIIASLIASTFIMQGATSAFAETVTTTTTKIYKEKTVKVTKHRKHKKKKHRKHKTKVVHHHHYHEDDDDLDAGEIAAIGIIGLAAGMILTSALNEDTHHPAPQVTYTPPRPYPQHYGNAHAQPVPLPVPVGQNWRPAPSNGKPMQLVTHAQSPVPWTREWFRYCSMKYRSFNPQTGTFTTYSGVQKLCK